MKVYIRGDVIVNEIKVGDVHYEYDYGVEIKSTVISLPERDGLWTWQSKTDTGKVIDYAVNERYTHYSPKLYTYRAYKVNVTL